MKIIRVLILLTFTLSIYSCGTDFKLDKKVYSAGYYLPFSHHRNFNTANPDQNTCGSITSLPDEQAFHDSLMIADSVPVALPMENNETMNAHFQMRKMNPPYSCHKILLPVTVQDSDEEKTE